jgi:hypothetical protein
MREGAQRRNRGSLLIGVARRREVGEITCLLALQLE